MVKVKRGLLFAAGTLIAVAIVIGAVVGTKKSNTNEAHNSNALRGALEPASAITAPEAPPEAVETPPPSAAPSAQCNGQRCGSLCCNVNEVCSLLDLGTQRSAFPACLPKASPTSISIGPTDTAVVAAPGKSMHERNTKCAMMLMPFFVVNQACAPS
jgi:hypothetical protein